MVFYPHYFIDQSFFPFSLPLISSFFSLWLVKARALGTHLTYLCPTRHFNRLRGAKTLSPTVINLIPSSPNTNADKDPLPPIFNLPLVPPFPSLYRLTSTNTPPSFQVPGSTAIYTANKQEREREKKQYFSSSNYYVVY